MYNVLVGLLKASATQYAPLIHMYFLNEWLEQCLQQLIHVRIGVEKKASKFISRSTWSLSTNYCIHTLQVYLQFELTLSSKEEVSDNNSPTGHFFEKHECLVHCHIAKQCLLFTKLQLQIYSKTSSLQTLVYSTRKCILHRNSHLTGKYLSLFTLRNFQKVTYEILTWHVF